MTQTLVRGCLLAFAVLFFVPAANAQQYAAYVMDARTGKALHSSNANTRVHPASLTKMMTLYIVFDQVKRGRLSLDQKIPISKNAASEPPSKLGLKAGQSIELRYLIRAAAVKSANDAATAMGEAVAGSESAFANLMNQYARAMGMSSTTFKNAHGLTAEGHMSTARDMAELGRRLYFDFPQYYNLFSRNSTSAGIKTVRNTNRRLLDAYAGADGIKTGYTRAAGFALVSSAQRGNRRVIVSVLGAKSSASRNAEVARLMDLGFREMPATARAIPPAPLRVATADAAVPTAKPSRAAPVAIAALPESRGSAASARAVVAASGGTRTAVASSRPLPRAIGLHTPIARSNEIIAAAIAEVNSDLEVAQASRRPAGILARMGRPEPRPTASAGGAAVSAGSASTFAVATPEPRQRSVEAAIVTVPDRGDASTGGNDWGVQLGAFRSKGDAERQLLTTALQDVPHLSGGLRRVEAASVQGVTVYRAQFVGLDQQAAQQACQSITRQNATCETLAPGI